MLNDAVHKYNSKEKSNVRCCNCNKLVLKHNNYKSEDGKYFCNHNCYVKYKLVAYIYEELNSLSDRDKINALKYNKHQVLAMIRYMYEKNIDRDRLEDQLDDFPDIVTWDIGRVVSDYRRLLWNSK